MDDNQVKDILRQIVEAHEIARYSTAASLRGMNGYRTMWGLIHRMGEKVLAEAPDAMHDTREFGLLMEVIAEALAGGGHPLVCALDEARIALEEDNDG